MRIRHTTIRTVVMADLIRKNIELLIFGFHQQTFKDGARNALIHLAEMRQLKKKERCPLRAANLLASSNQGLRNGWAM
jgi:hypothetical protein